MRQVLSANTNEPVNAYEFWVDEVPAISRHRYAILTPAMLRADLLPCQPPEQKHTEYDEKNIWKPDEQFRVRMWISTQCIPDDDKEKIGGGYDQTHGESNRSLATMRRNSQRNPNYGERNTRKWK